MRQRSGEYLSMVDHEMSNGVGWAYWESRGGGLLVLLKHGLAVFRPDIPMSDEGVYEHPMKQIVDGVNAATDAVLATGLIDETRIAVRGKGLGGYMVEAVATQGTRFKTGISEDGWPNLASRYGVSSPELYNAPGGEWRYFDVERGRMEQPLWEDPVRYMENSPISHINQVRIPLLLFNGKWGHMSDFADRLL